MKQPWLAATVLSIEETGLVNHAMHDRWLSESPLPCPLGADDAGWADLYAAGYTALMKHREAKAIEARRAATTGAVEDESAVPKGFAQTGDNS